MFVCSFSVYPHLGFDGSQGGCSLPIGWVGLFFVWSGEQRLTQRLVPTHPAWALPFSFASPTPPLLNWVVVLQSGALRSTAKASGPTVFRG